MTAVKASGGRPRMKDVPSGIEQYFLGFLLKGEFWNRPDQTGLADLMPRHLGFIRQQIEVGRYLLAGPVTDGGPLVGISIIAAKSAEEALEAISQDPAVQEGVLLAEIHSAFLPSLKGLKITYPNIANPEIANPEEKNS